MPPLFKGGGGGDNNMTQRGICTNCKKDVIVFTTCPNCKHEVEFATCFICNADLSNLDKEGKKKHVRKCGKSLGNAEFSKRPRGRPKKIEYEIQSIKDKTDP